MSIKILRTQSMLKELLIEAISQLNDERINNVNITSVECSRGKYNAKVLVQIDSNDKKEVIKALKNAQGILKEFILSNSGWFKCPNLQFEIDESLENENNLEKIFKQISNKN